MSSATDTGEMVSFDIDAAADMLETIADWKDDLRARIQRAELTFMLADTDVDTDTIAAEVEVFKKVCKVLAWRPNGIKVAA